MNGLAAGLSTYFLAPPRLAGCLSSELDEGVTDGVEFGLPELLLLPLLFWLAAIFPPCNCGVVAEGGGELCTCFICSC